LPHSFRGEAVAVIGLRSTSRLSPICETVDETSSFSSEWLPYIIANVEFKGL
jgi:hypothetical protein